MRNQKEINEAKFAKECWKLRNGAFCLETIVTRQPFGAFKVIFETCYSNGLTGVSIVSVEYPKLSRYGTAGDYKNAVRIVAEHFERLDALKIEIDRCAEEAEKVRQKMLAEAIEKTMKRHTKIEQQGIKSE